LAAGASEEHAMSFWSKLFGGGGDADTGGEPASAGPGEDYKGFTIRYVAMAAGSEFQLSGKIEKDGKEHTFIRADRFGSKQDAQSATLAKGRQIIDEQGEKVFEQSWPARSA
jgi:hypothetical protein